MCLIIQSQNYLRVKPIFHLATLFARTDKKVGTLPTCLRRIFSAANFNQSRCRILVFASRRANKVAKWKIGFKDTSCSTTNLLQGSIVAKCCQIIKAKSVCYRFRCSNITVCVFRHKTLHFRLPIGSRTIKIMTANEKRSFVLKNLTSNRG